MDQNKDKKIVRIVDRVKIRFSEKIRKEIEEGAFLFKANKYILFFFLIPFIVFTSFFYFTIPLLLMVLLVVLLVVNDIKKTRYIKNKNFLFFEENDFYDKNLYDYIEKNILHDDHSEDSVSNLISKMIFTFDMEEVVRSKNPLSLFEERMNGAKKESYSIYFKK